jgi:hypothetical protein
MCCVRHKHHFTSKYTKCVGLGESVIRFFPAQRDSIYWRWLPVNLVSLRNIDKCQILLANRDSVDNFKGRVCIFIVSLPVFFQTDKNYHVTSSAVSKKGAANNSTNDITISTALKFCLALILYTFSGRYSQLLN